MLDLVDEDEHDEGPDGGADLCDDPAGEEPARVPAHAGHADLDVGEDCAREKPGENDGPAAQSLGAQHGGAEEGGGEDVAGQATASHSEAVHNTPPLAGQEKCQEGHHGVRHGVSIKLFSV